MIAFSKSLSTTNSILLVFKYSSIKYSGISNSFGDIKINLLFLYLDNALTKECTVLPNFKSPHSPIVKLSSLFFSHEIVNKSSRRRL